MESLRQCEMLLQQFKVHEYRVQNIIIILKLVDYPKQILYQQKVKLYLQLISRCEQIVNLIQPVNK